MDHWIKKRISRKTGQARFTIAIPEKVQAVTNYKTTTLGTLEEARAYRDKAENAYDAHARDNKVNTPDNFYDPTTVDSLFNFYTQTEEYRNLKPSSKRAYQLMMRTASELRIENINKRFGLIAVNQINRTTVRHFTNTIRDAISHHRAFHTVKVMRLIWYAAIREDRLDNNPWQKHKITAPEDRSVEWKSSEVQHFVDACDKRGLHSLGTMALMCYRMCQRPGDVRQLKWENLIEDVFVFHQEKTGTHMTIPVTTDVQKRLAKYHPEATGTILINEHNRLPYDRYVYYKLAKKIIAEEKMRKELRIGDLRRSGTTLLANHGSTEDELRSVTGHKSREVLSVYVNRSAALARNALKRLPT